MPVFTSSPITVFDQESFHALDKVATGCAFDIHNEVGRYLDERLYQTELAARLNDRRLAVVREMKITLTLDGFTRNYHVDILVTASVHRPQVVQEHHRRFLEHTRLRAIQWINLNRQTVSLHTIQK
jgi:GxxExxY protein